MYVSEKIKYYYKVYKQNQQPLSLLDYWFIIKGCNNSGTAQWKRYIRHPKLTLCHRRYLFGLGNLRSFLKTKISVESESDLSMPFILQNNSFVHLKSTEVVFVLLCISLVSPHPPPFPPPLLDFFFLSTLRVKDI